MISDHQTENKLIKEKKELGEDRMKQTTIPRHLLIYTNWRQQKIILIRF
jgi:hypothetical protein